MEFVAKRTLDVRVIQMGEKIEVLSCDTSEGACQRKKEMATRRNTESERGEGYW